jgi:hypothetical protein
MKMKTAVYILTWCRCQESLWANRLVFKTIRTGFPDAKIIVHDNASPYPWRGQIAQDVRGVGGEFYQIDHEVAHWDFIRNVIETTPFEDITFCDPDVVFWDKIEMPTHMVSGRLLPEWYDRFSATWTWPRLHTSLLQVHGVRALRSLLTRLEVSGWAQFNALRPFRYVHNGRWETFDTCSQLYHYLRDFEPDQVHAFTPKELDRYDHVFGGTWAQVFRRAPRQLIEQHEAVRADINSARGLWRLHDIYFTHKREEKYSKNVLIDHQEFAVIK